MVKQNSAEAFAVDEKQAAVENAGTSSGLKPLEMRIKRSKQTVAIVLNCPT